MISLKRIYNILNNKVSCKNLTSEYNKLASYFKTYQTKAGKFYNNRIIRQDNSKDSIK